MFLKKALKLLIFCYRIYGKQLYLYHQKAFHQLAFISHDPFDHSLVLSSTEYYIYTTLKYFAHFSRFLSQFTFEFSHSDFNTLIRSLDIYILTSYPSKTFDFSLLNFWFQPSFSGQLLELLSLIKKKRIKKYSDVSSHYFCSNRLSKSGKI